MAPEALPSSTAADAPSGKLKGRDYTCFNVFGPKSLPDPPIWIRGKCLTILIYPSDDSKSLEFLSNSRNLIGIMTNPNSKFFVHKS